MKILFLLLVLANLGYFAWQLYNQPQVTADIRTPLPVDNHTPPLVLMKEMPRQSPQAAPVGPQSQREPMLQELPTADAEQTLSPAP